MIRRRGMGLPIYAAVFVALLVAGGFWGIIHLAGFGTGYLPQQFSMYETSVLVEAVGALYALILLLLFGYGGVLADFGDGGIRGFYTGGYLVAYAFLGLAAQLYLQMMAGGMTLNPPSEILAFTGYMLLVGFAEELVFRGVVLNLFLEGFRKTKGGILAAVLLDGVLFGALHLNNYFSGVSLKSAAIQALVGAMAGIVFAAVYARCRNIWVVVFTHAMMDFAGLAGSGLFGNGDLVQTINQYSTEKITAVLVFLLPALVLLRPSKLREMEQRAQNITIFDTYREADNSAKMSLLLGILGILTGILGYGMGISIVGILAAICSKSVKEEQNGLAAAGMVLSVIGLFLSIGMLVLIMFYFQNFSDLSVLLDRFG